MTDAKRRSTRDRMLDSAVVLLSRRGGGATTVDAVLADSGAPRGSVYHHFPGGRQELLRDALTSAGAVIEELIANAVDRTDTRAALESFAGLWRVGLEASGYRAGCPVLALVVDDGPGDEDLRALAGEIFERWQERLQALLVEGGVPTESAYRRAGFVLAAIEGAIVLCRAQRSSRPLDDAVVELGALLAAAPSAPPSTESRRRRSDG